MDRYENILKFYNEYIKLEQIIRKGWIMCNVPADRLESVADHTLQLLMLSSVVTRELNIDVDTKRLMEMLLIHDLGEVVIGDISAVEVDCELKKEKEASAIKLLLDNLSEENSKYYYDLWIEMDLQNTEMAKFAFLLDKIDAVIKSMAYEREYNIEGLFDEFSGLQKKRGTFENSSLEGFYNYINSKHDIKRN